MTKCAHGTRLKDKDGMITGRWVTNKNMEHYNQKKDQYHNTNNALFSLASSPYLNGNLKIKCCFQYSIVLVVLGVYIFFTERRGFM